MTVCIVVGELRSLLLEFSAGTLTKPSELLTNVTSRLITDYYNYCAGPLRKIKPSSAEMVSDESSKRKTHHLRVSMVSPHSIVSYCLNSNCLKRTSSDHILHMSNSFVRMIVSERLAM